MENKVRQTKLQGIAIITAKEWYCINYEKDIIARTLIEVPAEFMDDWQCDAHYWHNEGTIEFDIDNFEIVYPREYEYLDSNGEWKEGKRVINKDDNSKVYQEQLEEV